MKRFIRTSTAATALALLAVTALAGCSSTPASGASGAEGVVSPGKLTVCMNAAYAPMEYYEGTDTTNPVGFDVDLAKAAAKQLHLEFVPVEVSLKGIIPALNAGRCDVAWSSLYVTTARSSAASPVPYLKTGYALLVHKNDNSIRALTDLAGKTLAYQTGSADEPKLADLQKQLASAHLKPVQPLGTDAGVDVVQNVLNGKADAAFQTDVSTADVIKTTGDKLKAVPNAYPADNSIGAYTNKGAPINKKLIDALKAVREAGISAKIVAKWGLDAQHLI